MAVHTRKISGKYRHIFNQNQGENVGPDATKTRTIFHNSKTKYCYKTQKPIRMAVPLKSKATTELESGHAEP
jgi:hypothetical protein